MRARIFFAALVGSLLLSVAPAFANGKPMILYASATQTSHGTTRLRAEILPNGSPAHYRLDLVVTEGTFEAWGEVRPFGETSPFVSATVSRFTLNQPGYYEVVATNVYGTSFERIVLPVGNGSGPVPV